jgi:predicted DNA-binding antitoxin AbrB/MazE fold protein
MCLYGKGRKGLLNAKTKLTMVMHMGIKAVYENDVLKPFGKLDLQEGEEVEIELKRKAEKKHDILSYAGLLKDLDEDEERLFKEAVKRANLFGRALKL